METEVLGRLPYFSQLPAKELELVSSSVQSLPLARGNILFNEGEPSRGLYFVVEGAIKVSRISPEGREQVLTVVGGTQTFNEVPVFDGGPCPATAAALEPSVVGLIPMDVMQRLIKEYPVIAEATLRIFAGRLRGLVTLVADLTHLDVTGRVAKVLLAYNASSGRVSLQLGQQDLASIVGSTREVVSRSLRQLEEQGDIARDRRGLKIVSAQKLSAALDDSTR
jgi:CRP/FNR family transcriptional regulator